MNVGGASTYCLIAGFFLHLYTRARAPAHPHIHTHTHTHTHIHTHTYTHTHAHTTHSYTQTYTHTYTHTYTRSHTLAHTHTNTYTHTYTHTLTHRFQIYSGMGLHPRLGATSSAFMLEHVAEYNGELPLVRAIYNSLQL